MLETGRSYTEKEIELLAGLFSNHKDTGFFQMNLETPLDILDNGDRNEIVKIFSHKMRLSSANQAFANHYGAKVGDLIGLSPADFFKDDSVQLREVMLQLINEGTCSRVTYEFRLDGSQVIIKGEYVLLHNDKKQIVGLIGIQNDITEQVESERKRSEQTNLLTISEEITQSASFEWDPIKKKQEYSEGVYRIFGFSQDEKPTQESLYSRIHSEDREAFFEGLKTVGQNPQDESFVKEVRVYIPGEKIKTIWIKLTQEFNNENELTKIYGAIQDITERKRKEILTDVIYNISQAASDLNEFKEFYKKIQFEINRLIDANNMFVAFYDENNNLLNIQYVTGESKKFTQLPADGTISKLVIVENKSFLLDDKTLKNFDQSGKIKRIGKSSKNWLGVPLRKDNEAFGVLVVQNYERDDAFDKEDQALLEFISIQVVSAIRRMQDSEQIEILRNSIQQSPVSVVITDVDGNVEYVNPKFEEVTGFTQEEVISENPRILKSGTQSVEYYRNLWNTILNGQEWRGEFQNRRKDGSFYWEHASISPVKNASGKITHFVAVKEDITERKMMEKDLVEAKEKAEESDKLKTAFLANLSHEIRTPMNGILGFSELLRETDIEEREFGRYVDIINSNGNQLLNIIDDIITISNLEVKQLKIRKHDIDLVSFLEDLRLTMEMEKKGLGKKLVQLDFPLFASESNIINTDESKLNQILTNLLKNALKFTEEGSIMLRFSRLDAHMIRFSVSDSGVGIPEEMQEVIFDRFRQVDESNTRNFGGTGLGLAISRGLVELLGGEIWVESELGKGATFHFSLKL